MNLLAAPTRCSLILASQALWGIARVSSHFNAITDVAAVDHRRRCRRRNDVNKQQQPTTNTIARCNAEANEAVLLKTSKGHQTSYIVQ